MNYNHEIDSLQLKNSHLRGQLLNMKGIVTQYRDEADSLELKEHL